MSIDNKDQELDDQINDMFARLLGVPLEEVTLNHDHDWLRFKAEHRRLIKQQTIKAQIAELDGLYIYSPHQPSQGTMWTDTGGTDVYYKDRIATLEAELKEAMI